MPYEVKVIKYDIHFKAISNPIARIKIIQNIDYPNK